MKLKFSIFFCIGILLLLLMKGIPGNGLSQARSLMSTGQAFEDSIGRGRYALVLSLVENKRTDFSKDIAAFAAPDVASSKGKFVSIFPPGTALFLTPFYTLGSFFGLGQLATQAGIIVLALLNGIMLYLLAKKLDIHPTLAVLTPIFFLLTSNALVYTSVLAQHQLSTLLLLIAFHCLLLKNKSLAAALVICVYASSFAVDWPNLVIMFPVVIAVLAQSLRSLAGNRRDLSGTILLCLLAIVPILGYGIFTIRSGNSLAAVGQFLPRVTNITGNVITKTAGDKTGLAHTFFIKKIPYGIYVLFFSRERGLIFFAPIFFLSIFGLNDLKKKNNLFMNILIATVGLNIVLYASFGDPWGGPSFGPRYLIPSFALLSVLLSIVVGTIRKNIVTLSIFSFIAAISAAISMLGAVTTSMIPTAKEAAKQHLTYPITVAFNVLQNGDLGSFVYRTTALHIFTALQWYAILVTISCGLLFYTIERARRSVK